MKRYVEYDIDGTPVVVEVEDAEQGLELAGPVDDAVIKARQGFEQALDSIGPLANKLMTKLRDLASSPDEIQVEFGLKLGFQTSAIIASGGTDANFKISLAWKREPGSK